MSSQLKARSRRWIWFFIVVGTLGAAGVTAEIWSNLNQQLTPEKLAEARAVWKQKGPRNYDLDYEIKREDNPDPAPRTGAKVTVHVENGQAQEPLTTEFGSMDALFDYIERRLRADREFGGSRPFVKATFDHQDGHIVHFVHSVMKTRERLEITVTLRPLAASEGQAQSER
jgi:hypothetical protein